MYKIGICKICNQGFLEVVRDVQSNKIFICCDECEAEWDDPYDALKGKNGTRGKYGQIYYPSKDDILKLNWGKEIENIIFNHNSIN